MSMLTPVKFGIARAVNAVSPRLWIELSLMRRNRNLEPELWLLEHLLDKDKVAVDVGANKGIFSLFMLKHAGAVHAFEPNPQCYRDVRRVLPARASVHQIALGEEPGELVLRYDPDNTGRGTCHSDNPLEDDPDIKTILTERVEARRLDSMGLSDVGFIKIDVEGFEESVLRGAEGLLEAERPNMLIEIEERHNPGGLSRIIAFLGPLGYEARYLKDGRLHAVKDAEAMQRRAVSEPGQAGEHIYNFFFLQPEGLARLERALSAG